MDSSNRAPYPHPFSNATAYSRAISPLFRRRQDWIGRFSLKTAINQLSGRNRFVAAGLPTTFIFFILSTPFRTSPYYPQSNGKIERWRKSLKGECIRPGTPLSPADARRLLEGCVEHYNDVRLNSVPLATSRRKTCSPAVSRRYMLSEIGSWRTHENSVRFVGGRPREEGRYADFR
jgi:hypothetical protein